MKKILITGTSGFIAQSLCKTLSKSGRPVRGAARSINSLSANTDIEYVSVGDISLKKNWKDTLVDVDCVIHCAGRTHVMNETKTDTLKIYRSVNVDGTKQLAEQAAKAEVKRLIFLSSIKVNGESTNIDNDIISNNQKKNIFTNNDIPNPEDSYAISKLEAEKVLWEISAKTNLEVVVVRLPLVYGYGVKGNMARLMKLINSGIPLPFSLIKNQRSLIGIDNLVDVLIRCVDHPEASGKTFLVSDGEDLSTPDLLRHVASSMERSTRLFPFPISLLKLFGFAIGKSSEINRLTNSLQVDISFTRKILNWSPPLTVQEGIRRMVPYN